MTLTRASGYGLYALLYLARQPSQHHLSAEEISGSRDFPKPFFHKVLQMLVRAGLLMSNRGTGGGFTLARPPAEISLQEAIEALQGPMQKPGCPIRGRECRDSAGCPVYSFCREVDDRQIQLLSRKTVADLLHAGDPACIAQRLLSDVGGMTRERQAPGS